MPAAPKYLTTSNWQRFVKITAAIIGGYILTITMHLAIAIWAHLPNTIMTMSFSGFIVWVGLMIVAFIPKNGLKTWAIYLGLSFLFSIIIYFGK